MKDHIRHNCLYTVLIFLLVTSSQAHAEVYKTVDKDGNVIYTDQAPDVDSQPLELRGLSVISPQKPSSVSKASSQPLATEAVVGGEEEVTSIWELRRGYREFAIVSPAQDQNFWDTGNEATIAWGTRNRLQEGMTVTIFVDGKQLEPTTNSSIIVGDMWRGAHEVYAELKDASNRQIARTSTVTFHIKQFSVNFPVRRNQGG